jgi:putative hydrolase of the HAD superfamily
MKVEQGISTLFLDIGGVLLTDGWDRYARRRAAREFKLDFAEMEERHHLAFETYEEGRLTLEGYLGLVVFHQKRPFARPAFRRFMFSQSKPIPKMLALCARLKDLHRLRVIAVSNEARELNAYRIHQFNLTELVDAFVSSCFVHVRKPDSEIFRLALDVAQAPARQVAFIDNTAMFVDIARSLGIRAIHHTDYSSTVNKLAALGLRSGDGAVP